MKDNAVILRWGDERHSFSLKVFPENNTDDISKKEIAKYKEIMEDLIKAVIKEYCKNDK